MLARGQGSLPAPGRAAAALGSARGGEPARPWPAGGGGGVRRGQGAQADLGRTACARKQGSWAGLPLTGGAQSSAPYLGFFPKSFIYFD